MPAQRGPKAVPGAYQLHLTAGSATQSTTFKLLADPKAHLTQLDYQSQHDLLMQIQHALAQIQQAGATIQSRRANLPTDDPALTQLNALQTALGTGANARGGRAGGAPRAASNGTPPLMGEFTSLYTFVIDSEDRPTGAALDRYRNLRKSLDAELAKLPTGP
jgi:hypothetical protein